MKILPQAIDLIAFGTMKPKDRFVRMVGVLLIICGVGKPFWFALPINAVGKSDDYAAG